MKKKGRGPTSIKSEIEKKLQPKLQKTKDDKTAMSNSTPIKWTT